ncbi:hypothetical protein [Intrasporangium sp.]|uniref:hypothetical protein n=1 Tax=Intrasporangium sp. TaxID=1925024 RepID=UPI00293A5E34|nr:hypothetical protein [Intrasporangium sp.]MDV3221420.1 hypothetical protein [Intrasporangium sp.]
MTPHLRGHVRAYVDRALPPAVLHLYDRHLVACMMCRAAADQERRIVAALRADARALPGSLRSSLMSLASEPTPEPSPTPGPRIPLGPLAARGGRGALAPGVPAPLSTVPPSAPALHRSPMRAAVVASLAAGASVAAAWGLAVSPLPGGARPAAVRVPAGVASIGAVTYAPGMPSLPAVTRSGAAAADAVDASADANAPARTVSTHQQGTSQQGTGQQGTGQQSLGRERAGTGVFPLWVVSTASRLAPPSGLTAPVRISLITSAQSGP